MANSESKRVAFSPSEFAALFGKQQTWGYRQIYAGKVKAITEYGRIQIPAAEVERILASAERYDGAKQKPAKTKAEFQKLAPQLKSAWQSFLRQRRDGAPAKADANPAAVKAKSGSRKAVIDRLTRKPR